MKKLIKFLVYSIAVIALFALGLKVMGNGYLIKGVWATYLHGHNTASIDDMRFFDLGEVAATQPTPWQEHPQYNQSELSAELLSSLKGSESVAFVAIKNGKLFHEQYWDDYSSESHSNSFSMAKSITSILGQLAIQKGYISSWDEPVINYLPELKGEFSGQVTLRHLTTMTADLTWEEKYKSPFAITAKTYFGEDIKEVLYENVPAEKKPGVNYIYQSGATEYLGMAIEKAVGKPIYEFASEALWGPIGAEETAYWHLDHQGGMALTFCCFNSNATDFARLGQLMHNNGQWNGQSLLDSAYTGLAQQPYRSDFYGHSFWLDHEGGEGVYYFHGILGQYIIVFPERDLVVVRLGKKRIMDSKSPHPSDFRVIVDQVKSMNW